MAKYLFKGTDINNLIVTGGTAVNNFAPSISYTPASPYSTERPLELGFKQNGTDISTIMNAKFIEYTTVNTVSTYDVPTDYNSFRAVLEGGGGGGGGGGGCGWSGSPQDRQSADPGAPGSNGGFVYVADTTFSNRTITYFVGAGGGAGGGGQSEGSPGQASSQPGQDGGPGQFGQRTYINFTTPDANYTVLANAGARGNGGQGGPAPGNANTEAVQFVTNSYPSISFSTDGNQQATAIPSAINPISYKSTYSYLGNGGSGGPGDGAPGGGGQRGYIRLYLLKS